MSSSARTVMITGAAAGIGRVTALRFAAQGCTVGAFDVDSDGLATVSKEIEQAGGTPVAGVLDVRDAEQFADAVKRLASETGRLDVLVNNAGILLGGNFEDRGVGEYHREIDINVKGVVNGLHAAFPHLRDTPGATVVNLGSASAIYGQAELANYSATKFFVRGITEALDLEWAKHDIRVIAMWPLYVKTAMTETLDTGTTRSMGIRLGPGDVADAIVAATEPNAAQRLIHQVHFPVGLQTRVLSLGSRFSPGWLTRIVNKKFADV